jgi:hypothetical protein
MIVNTGDDNMDPKSTLMINLLALSSSLGSLLAIALVVCGILIAIIAVSISRKKGQ